MIQEGILRDWIELGSIYWERFLELCSEHQPLPLLAGLALAMFIPLYLFRWGTLDPFLEEGKWKELPLSEKIICNHNTRRFRQVTCKLANSISHRGLKLFFSASARL